MFLSLINFDILLLRAHNLWPYKCRQILVMKVLKIHYRFSEALMLIFLWKQLKSRHFSAANVPIQLAFSHVLHSCSKKLTFGHSYSDAQYSMQAGVFSQDCEWCLQELKKGMFLENGVRM